MADTLHSNVYADLGEFGTFDTVSGGELQQTVTDYTPGGSRQARKLKGGFKYSDIVLTRAWDPGRDNAVVDWMKRSIVDGIDDPRTLTKHTKTAQGGVADTKSYNVVPSMQKLPDGKAGDDSVAELSITLSVVNEL